jgi:hypothetical protein
MQYTFRPWVIYKDDSAFQPVYEEVGLITGNKRKDNGPEATSRRRCLHRVIANLYHTQVEQLIILLSKNKYTTGTMYSQQKIRGGVTYANMRNVLERMIDAGYLDVYQGDMFPMCGTFYSNIRIRPKMRQFFETLNLSEIDHDPIPIKIKEEGVNGTEWNIPKQGDYPDRIWEDLERIAATMDRYNAKIQNVDITWVPEPLYQTVYGTDRPDLHAKYLTAQFKRQPWLGGRMYHGFWVNMRQAARAYIKIDGEEIMDFDFSHFFVQLVYEKANKAMGTNIPVPKQPYLYEKVENPELRDLAKTFFQNSKDKSKRSEAERVSDYIRAYKKKHEAKNGKWDKEVYLQVIADLEELHKPIEAFYAGDIWGELQKAESDIMRTIMDQCMDQDIIILPIHDGFLCKQCDGFKVKDILDAIGYKYRYGWPHEMITKWKSKFKFKEVKPHTGWKGPQKMVFNKESYQWEPMKLNGTYCKADLAQFWEVKDKGKDYYYSGICSICLSVPILHTKEIMRCSNVPWKCREIHPPTVLTKSEIMLMEKNHRWVLSPTEMKAILVPGREISKYQSLADWNKYVEWHNECIGFGDWTDGLLQFFRPGVN